MCKPMHLSLVFTVNSKVLKYFALLMCLKDLEDKGIEKEKPEDMEKSHDCPLCLEPLEMDDKNFFPCTCDYQVCRFCWHRIKTTENGLCPACRRIYPENPANFVPLTTEELQKYKHQKKMKEAQKKQKLAESRKQLANIRVIQKNLVFAVGLPLELSQDAEKKEKILQMFRQFGNTQKETITDRTNYAGAQGPSACVYITYQKPEDAVKAVKSLTNTKIDGRTIKVSLGTTKYCSNFLKGVHCPKTECLYLHEIAEEEASFTKEEIHAGKHLEYETKLLDQTHSSSSNSKFPTANSETNYVNHNHSAEEGSECSDDLHQNNSFTNSDVSDLSPSSNQSLQNSRNVCSDVHNQIENNLQNLHLSNSELRTNSDIAKKLVFRSEENLIINGPSFQDSVNSHLSNHIQPKESEQQHSLQQPIFLNNQIFESASRGQSSPKESSILRIISSAKFENGHNQSIPDVLCLKREQMDSVQSKRDDDPDLEFDPCQESLKGLQDLLLAEAKERARARAREAARARLNVLNRSPLSNSPIISRSPLLANLHSADSLGYRNASFQASKVRDPPPGFSNSSSQNFHFKSPIEFSSSLLHESPVSLQNHAGNLRSNFSLQRFQLPGTSVNNSYFPDFSPPTLPTREIPEFSSPVMQQQNQRLVNLSQLQFPSDQRTSPQWNNTNQSQWRPMENLFFNQSVTESGSTNDFSLRMPPVRSEATMRQWQQFPPNVNNLSPFQDHPMTPEQLAKVQVLKAVESAQRNSGFGHRLQYTKKL